MGPEAVEFIEVLQPFNAPHGPDRHLLTALSELSNQDKHRSLMPAFSAIQREPGLADGTVVGVHDVRAPIEGGKLLAGRALSDGDLVLEAPIEILGPDPMVEIEGRLPLDVALAGASCRWKDCGRCAMPSPRLSPRLDISSGDGVGVAVGWHVC